MSEHQEGQGAAGAEGLQFDQAEYDAPAATEVACTACQRPIADAYYEVNGKVICAGCREAVHAQLTGGSKVRRFVRAAIFGTFAGALGCGLYFLVRRLTGYEFSLISILVGYMVGASVRGGSDHRGGRLYQALAVFLTYTAIVGNYVPDLMEGVVRAARNRDVVAVGAANPAPPGQAAAAAKPRLLPPKRPASPVVKAVALVVFTIVILGLAYAAPFLMGFQDLIGLLIIFFALQQAWFLNRKLKLEIGGPYVLATAADEQAAEGTLDHA
jgi:hypothetical protein